MVDRISAEIPECLYHYTTIDTLALILKNRTIRLNSLAEVDDLDEGLNDISEDLKANQFVSCWTADESENIPLWSMYSNSMQGVRIKLPAFFFPDSEGIISQQNALRATPIMVGGQVTPLHFSNKMLVEVDYVDKIDDLVANVKKPFKNNDEWSSYKYSEIGSKKMDWWRFQNEWRYKIYCFNGFESPIALFGADIFKEEDFLTPIFDDIDNKSIPKNKVSYMDLPIADESFNRMEILMGPRVNAGQEIIIEELLRTFNKQAFCTLDKSDLRINI